MRTNSLKFISILTIILFVSIYSACKKDEDDNIGTNPTNNNLPERDYTSEDRGNLAIFNQTDYELDLYNSNEYVLSIKEDASVICHIDDTVGSVTLILLKKDNNPDINNPEYLNESFKSITTVLSGSDADEERFNWFVNETENESGSGSIVLSYPEIDKYGREVIYNVDIYLNSTNGAYLISLRPGFSGKNVSVSYGTHTLYYKYWCDNQYDELGIIEHADKIILNSAHQQREIEVPVFYNSQTGRNGILNIKNNMDYAITVYGNNNLIEKLVITTEIPNGLSDMATGDSTDFILEQDQYNIEIKKHQETATIYSFDQLYPLENNPIYLVLDEDITYQNITIKNQTTKEVVIYNRLNNDYVGYFIVPNSEVNAKLNQEYELAAYYFGDQSKITSFDNTSESWIITDESFMENLPTLTTIDITSITQTTAIGGGNINNDGSSSIIARGVCWSTNQNPTTYDSKTEDGTGTGSFTSNITGLAANTTYYVRAYAINSVGTSYSTQINFMTLGPPELPIVSTGNINSYDHASVEVEGNISNLGDGFVIQHGHCWSTNQNPTVADNKIELGSKSEVGNFTSSISGLTKNTTYYVKAYATNSLGVSYGVERTFTTEDITIVSEGLIAYYPFNGNTEDESSNQINLNNYNATLTSDINNNPNRAYFFNGQSAYLTTSNNQQLNDFSSISISLWLNIYSSVVDWPTIINKLYYVSINGFSGFYLGLNKSDKTIRWRINNNYIEAAYQENTWIHIVAVCNSNNMSLYKNGVNMGSLEINSGPNSNSAYFFIGRQSQVLDYSQTYFNGIIDEVILYNRVLTQSEITEIYNAKQ